MLAIGQDQPRVILEVIPTESLLAAIDADADLAGNPQAAEELTNAGMEVDGGWPAQRLGPAHPGRLASALAGRPRFEALKERVNRVSETVNRVAPFEVPEWKPERQTVLFRATLPIDPRDAGEALDVASQQARIVGVYNDPQVAIAYRTFRDPGYGTVDDVAALMSCDRLRDAGLTGTAVPVAVVDAGINVEYLAEQGREHALNQDLSYVARSPHRAGEFPVDHGTLCAFQVGIAAPDATLIDHGVLGQPVETIEDIPLIKAWLSDIQPGYRRLYDFLTGQPASERRLVITNSWAMISAAWDFGFGHVENFSDSVNHPFNRQVAALVDVGADVLFAAGNCGDESPVPQCGLPDLPICGANSLPDVITVAAVDIDGVRLGYSSQGPGRLSYEKPDLCGYSHYSGSGVDTKSVIGAVDWGTSTACPGVAGVVAAVRTRYSAQDLSPRDLKALLVQSARRPDGAEHNPDLGYGIIDPEALLDRLP